MKDFRFKPLLICIPILLILGGLLVFDRPAGPEGPGSPGQAGQTGQDADGADAKAVPVIRLDLVTGRAGSLEEDEGEPIYASPDAGSEELGRLQYNCSVLAAGTGSEDGGADAAGRPDGTDGTENADGAGRTAGSAGEDGWICVELPDIGASGYVQTGNVVTDTLEIADDGSMRSKIIKEAISHVGTPFEVGGTSLEEGIDCSNFVRQVYKAGGVAIRDMPNEIKAEGRVISRDEALPGDVVYYDVNDGGGHVALYLGDDFQISSMGHSGRDYPEGGVRIGKTVYRDRTEPIFIRIID